MPIPIILIIAILAFLATYLYKWYERTYALLKRAEKLPKQVLANGVNVWSDTISSDEIIAVTDGMADVLRRARCKGYVKKINPSDYTIALLPADQLDSQGLPAFKVVSDAYKGTEFDKGGYYLESGQTLVNAKCIFTVPHHADNFEHFRDAVMHEITHILYWHNDHDKYLATRVHKTGEVFDLEGC